MRHYRTIRTRHLLVALLTLLTACGRTIPPPRPQPLPAPVRAERELKLAEAREAYARNPADADAILALAMRTASLQRYQDAIAIFTEGAKRHPRDPRMYRQRGQRWITLRQFDLAIRDFRRAATLLDGVADHLPEPNATMVGGLPSTTLQSNVWYYLGLSHYLRGELDEALRAYRRCREVSVSPDDVVSSTYWLVLTLRALGRDAEADRALAPIRADLAVVDNADYLELLLMLRGEIAPEVVLRDNPSTVAGATQHYAVSRWYVHRGQPEQARSLLEKIVASGAWTSFAYMAAEAELRRR